MSKHRGSTLDDFLINDKSSLREDGDKNDPYEIFTKLVEQKKVSHNPNDPLIQKWIVER